VTRGYNASIIGSRTFNLFAITFIRSISLVVLLVTRPSTVLFTKSGSILESLFAYCRHFRQPIIYSRILTLNRYYRYYGILGKPL